MPRPVSINRSLTSFRRTTRPLSRYWLSPPLNTRRPTVMRPSSAPGRSRSVRSVSMHSAMPSGFRLSEPLKMTSSMVPPRSDLALCSPSTHVMASERLLLPQPLGPTMAVTPPAKRTSTGSTKDLKPETSRRSTFSMGSLRSDRGSLSEAAGRPQDMGAGWGGALDVAILGSYRLAPPAIQPPHAPALDHPSLHLRSPRRPLPRRNRAPAGHSGAHRGQGPLAAGRDPHPARGRGLVDPGARRASSRPRRAPRWPSGRLPGGRPVVARRRHDEPQDARSRPQRSAGRRSPA